MRVEGRLDESDHLTYDEKHPIVLPRKHALTTLIIRHYHQQNQHAAGANHIISLMARRWWCTGLREAIKYEMQNCITCRRFKAKPAHPLMASPPKDRMGDTQQAFSSTSVDMAGPYEVKVGRSSQSSDQN
jgi:hypothetical protein